MVNQGHNKSILRQNAYRAQTSLKVVQGHYKLVKPVLKVTWFKKTRNQNRSNRFDHNVIFLFKSIPPLILLIAKGYIIFMTLTVKPYFAALI